MDSALFFKIFDRFVFLIDGSLSCGCASFSNLFCILKRKGLFTCMHSDGLSLFQFSIIYQGWLMLSPFLTQMILKYRLCLLRLVTIVVQLGYCEGIIWLFDSLCCMGNRLTIVCWNHLLWLLLYKLLIRSL